MCVSLLLGKSVQPIRCNEYARAATVHSVASHLLRYMSRIQDSLTYASWYCIISALASSKLTSSNSTNSKTTLSTCRASKLWKAPVIGRCSNDATSSRVIITSPTRRWKLVVSLCHLSYKKMETSSFLMPPLHKCQYKSPITSVQRTCDQRT